MSCVWDDPPNTPHRLKDVICLCGRLSLFPKVFVSSNISSISSTFNYIFAPHPTLVKIPETSLMILGVWLTLELMRGSSSDILNGCATRWMTHPPHCTTCMGKEGLISYRVQDVMFVWELTMRGLPGDVLKGHAFRLTTNPPHRTD